MLGSEEWPVRTRGVWESKFESRERYRQLLEQVFFSCAEMMTTAAAVYVRTDARPFAFETTVEVLRAAFPAKQVSIVPRPFGRGTQTALYGDKSDKPGEIDIILYP